MNTKISNIVWFGTVVLLILCFTRPPVKAQKIMLSPELRIMSDRLVEKNDSGYMVDQVYDLGNPGEPGFKRVLYIYRINTNYETVATFDYKTDCGTDVEYIDHFYFKSNIVVLIKRKVPKSKDVEIAAVLVDKITLKKSSEKVLSFTSNEIKTYFGLETGSNDKFFFVKFGGRNSSAHFEKPEGVAVEAPMKRIVFTPDLREVKVDTKQLLGRKDYEELKAKGGKYDSKGGESEGQISLNNKEMVFYECIWKLNEKERIDVLSRIKFRHFTVGGESIDFSLDVEDRMMTNVSVLFNKEKDEIILCGLKKGNETGFSPGYFLVCLNPVDMKVKYEKYNPFDQQMIKRASVFYGFKKVPEGNLPTTLDFIGLNTIADGSSYIVWQFSFDASYTDTQYEETIDFTRPKSSGNPMGGFQTKRTSKSTYVNRADMGPIIVSLLDPGLNPTSAFFIPRWMRNFSLDRFAAISLKLVKEDLNIYYNDHPENVGLGLDVKEKRRTWNTLNVTSRATVATITKDGKLSRKLLLSEEESGKRMFVTLDSPDVDASGTTFDYLLLSPMGGAKPRLVNLKY